VRNIFRDVTFGVYARAEWALNVETNFRGQESAGIVTSEGDINKQFNVHKGMGMISTVFNDEAIKRLKGE